MNDADRKRLTVDLGRLVGEIAGALQGQMLGDRAVRARAERLHKDERVGEDFEVWTDLLARRAAVLWVLKSVYVRVLEDRGLCHPKRIVDEESQHLFERLAPDLGYTAYLRWVYRDLASAQGGLPELFAPQPAEVASVPDALSKKLLGFWRRADPDTGKLLFRFDDEHFDGRLMGDLYQDLDPVVRERYALVQTPGFVLDFILDETLTPALAEWGPEGVRVLDPSCGSGHFLLAALRRLVEAMRAKFPERPVREVVKDCLRRVVGIDLNDYACALARARLVMTALELCGDERLEAAADFHPQVYWADALEQVEREEQLEMAIAAPGGEQRATALLTRPEVRAALREVLKAKFHVVVGNPPYITEKDPKQREYHREKVGKERRYVSASGTYSLGAPFTERMLQLAVEGGCIGQITANSFMKREFGKALIEKVLNKEDLYKVVDTSGAFIPGHGTPTVLLFLRRQRPVIGDVLVVMGKRGEPGKPDDPARARVWSSIDAGHTQAGYEDEFISVASVPRAAMARHPWSIGGGGAAELKQTLDELNKELRTVIVPPVGRAARLGEDDAFTLPVHVAARLPTACFRDLLVGDAIRAWGIGPLEKVWCPYLQENDFAALDISAPRWTPATQWLWPLRRVLENRRTFQGDMAAAGLRWFEYMQYTPSANTTPLSIALSEITTHITFVLDRGGKVFNRSAPVIKLQTDATEDDHFALIAQLNSSTACFWLKQVCQNKGIRGEGGGFTVETWEQFYQFGGTKLEQYPVVATRNALLESFATRLDTIARTRIDESATAIIDKQALSGPRALRSALDARRQRDVDRLFQMVGLQEELDWLCYKLYSIDPDAEIRTPDQVPPLCPGLRAFEITLARDDAERRAMLARGEEPDEAPTAWFERHGWEPHTTLDVLPEAERAIVAERIRRTEASRNLSLVEQPTYKRRWYKPDHESEEREALETWLADRLEAWAKERPVERGPFTLRMAAVALQNDPAVQAVGELLAGRPDFDLELLLGERVDADSVPAVKHHVFTAAGLLKRKTWERCWEMQHREDAGEKVVPEVPEKYARADFLRNEYWSLRGKLDVPKERFIAFTEVPGASGPDALYGWAGCTPRQRARVLVELDERLEQEGRTALERRGVLHGIQFLLPYVAWESRDAADEFRAIVKSVIGNGGITEEMLAEWAEAHPAPARGARGAKKVPKNGPPAAPRGKKADQPERAAAEPEAAAAAGDDPVAPSGAERRRSGRPRKGSA